MLTGSAHVTYSLCRMDRSTKNIAIEIAFQSELPQTVALTGRNNLLISFLSLLQQATPNIVA